MVKLESDIIYYGQTQICGQNYCCRYNMLYGQILNSNTWSNISYGHFVFHHVFELLNAHILWSNMQQIYGQNSRRSPYIIVTDMT